MPAREFALGAMLAVATAACQESSAPSTSDVGIADATSDVASSDVAKLDSSLPDTRDASVEGCTGGERPCPGCERYAIHVDRTAGCVLGSVAVACEDRIPASALLSCIADAKGELFVLSKQYPAPTGYRVCTKEEAVVAIRAVGEDLRCETG
ncbi:MAG: hypothetical protein JNL79_07175 [Myxococcales bacterium]|nr:hypothetical protein [Myxococcales bacterium]